MKPSTIAAHGLFVLATVACGTAPTPPRAQPGVAGAKVPKADPTAKPNDSQPAAPKTIGPLSPSASSPESSWQARQATWRKNKERRLERAALDEDLGIFLTIVHETFAPDDAERASFLPYAKKKVEQLKGLAPYPVDSVASGLSSIASRVDLCVRQPGADFPCVPQRRARLAKERTPPFEFADASDGTVRLTLHDLSRGDDPAWTSLSSTVSRFKGSKGLLIDMRGAWGSDPRGPMPWLEALLGQTLKPLRTLKQAPKLERWVQAYKTRFIDESRDPAHWQPLVGTPLGGAVEAKLPPIYIAVGADCEAACELIARILQTHANAVVTGGVRKGTSLHRGAPAVARLPNSGLDVYFYAAEYKLSKAIEAKTGPTHTWNAAVDAPRYDALPFATSELARVIKQGPRTTCASYRSYPNRRQAPARIRKKMFGSPSSCRVTPSFNLRSKAPLSALRRFADTCASDVDIVYLMQDTYSLTIHAQTGAARLLSQVAQNPLVEHVETTCNPPPTADRAAVD